MNNSTKTTTMKDVALKAGVSLGTVSKVFNNIPVGDEYRTKVLKAADELNYQLNSYARALRSNKTSTIALILPTLTVPFFAEVAEYCTRALQKRNYKTLIATTYFDPNVEQECIDMVQQNKVDGIIGITYNPDLEINENVPFVIFDRKFNSLVNCVSSDNFSGGELAAEILISKGCKKPLFLGVFSHVSGEVDKRPLGFEGYCRSKEIEPTIIKKYDEDGIVSLINYLDEHIHNNKLDFDGIFCNTDTIAISVMEFLAQKNISVPNDVQIIGFDGMKEFVTNKYYCSTICQPVEAMAEAAVDILTSDKITSSALVCLPVTFAYGGTTLE